MTNINSIRDALNAEQYRMQQAQKLIELFTEVRGRRPHNTDERAEFLEGEVKAGRLPSAIKVFTSSCMVFFLSY